MMDWNWGWGWGGMLIGGLFMLVFWGGLIALIVWGITRAVQPSGGTPHYSKTPLDIAKERYARGEITKEEFEQIKRDLS